MSAWQPIETAPKDGSTILTFDTDGDVLVSYWYEVDEHDEVGMESGWIGNNTYETDDFTPTHWMPLPPPPTDGGGE